MAEVRSANEHVIEDVKSLTLNPESEGKSRFERKIVGGNQTRWQGGGSGGG